METASSQKDHLKSQIQTLRSGNRTAIVSTLKEVRSSGSIEILSELFDLLVVQEDDQITAEICSILNDLKDQEAAGILVDAIKEPAYEKIRTALVAACWQNGLSYSTYLETFLEVAISGEYESAIEAFTVIEEAIGDLELGQREKLIQRLKSRILEADDQKKSLLSELIKVIALY